MYFSGCGGGGGKKKVIKRRKSRSYRMKERKIIKWRIKWGGIGIKRNRGGKKMWGREESWRERGRGKQWQPLPWGKNKVGRWWHVSSLLPSLPTHLPSHLLLKNTKITRFCYSYFVSLYWIIFINFIVLKRNNVKWIQYTKF